MGELVAKICKVENCEERATRKGLCGMHYARQRRTGTAGTAERLTRRKYTNSSCKVEGCGRKAYGIDLCEMHYARLRRTGETGEPGRQRTPGRTCRVPGCERKHSGKGYCAMHLRRVQTGGQPGQAAPLRSGNGYITKKGYRIVRKHGHPNARKSGEILEHVYVMAQELNRPLRPGETVHHENGVRHDNRPTNLELWATRHPSGQRVTDRIKDAVELLVSYRNDSSLWPKNADNLRKFLILSDIATPE